jgi:hypothetical protein
MTRKPKTSDAAAASIVRGLAAAKTMGRNVTVEHKRWKLPLLRWEKGKVMAITP